MNWYFISWSDKIGQGFACHQIGISEEDAVARLRARFPELDHVGSIQFLGVE